MKALRAAIDQMLEKQDAYRRAQQQLTAARRDYRESEDVVRTLRHQQRNEPKRSPRRAA